MLKSLRRPLIVMLLALGLPALAQAQAGRELPDGPAKELVEAACVACHESNLIVNESQLLRLTSADSLITGVPYSIAPESHSRLYAK